MPAFVGYTERALKAGNDLTRVPTLVESLDDFEGRFGGVFRQREVHVLMSADDTSTVESVRLASRYHLHNTMRLFFENGGRRCFVVSAGNFDDEPGLQTLLPAIDAIRAYDEPTLIACPDAFHDAIDTADCLAVQRHLLYQCEASGDRFALIDTPPGPLEACLTRFRDEIGDDALRFGAAYAPWLFTNHPRDLARELPYRSWRFNVETPAGAPVPRAIFDADDYEHPLVEAANRANDDVDIVREDFVGNHEDESARFARALRTFHDGTTIGAEDALGELFDVACRHAEILDVWPTKLISDLRTLLDEATIQALVSALHLLLRLQDNPCLPASLERYWPISASYWMEQFNHPMSPLHHPAKDSPFDPVVARKLVYGEPDIPGDDSGLKGVFSVLRSTSFEIQRLLEPQADAAVRDLYANHTVVRAILREATRELSLVPPSGAVAAAMAATDVRVGAWTAPAGIALTGVDGPAAEVDDTLQSDLLADENGRKSVNAIRTIDGVGCAIWGARTLARDESDFCYVGAQRESMLIGKSVLASLVATVFEPNTSDTWQRVNAAVTSYLYSKWQAGALAGNTPEESYFVNVGIGSSMEPVDLQENRLIVDVGIALTLPSEFSVLRISQTVGEPMLLDHTNG